MTLMKTSIQLEEHERQRCEIWTRVMGYHRPVSQFNPGKRSEYAERLLFRERAVGREVRPQ
jgi:anaerobic ribonucleoside-triphosphate reductase